MAESATTEQDVVKISGRGALVNIQIDDCVPVEVACRTLRERLGRGRHLYSHGEVIVDIGQRILSNDGPERIRNVIESESGLTIKRFWCKPSVLEREHQRIDSLMDLNSRTHDRVYGNGPGEGGGSKSGDVEIAAATADDIPVGYQGGDGPTGDNRQSIPADVVRGTCRAGEVLRFPGNVVVVGNVNPGAQIIAQGDILIFGTLRGTAHAGAGGDSTAVILAMSSVEPQLRIADCLMEDEESRAVAGRRRDGSADIPIIARIRNQAIHVSPYLKNHSIDHGGNPNER